MTALSLSLSTAQLAARMRDRLDGGANGAASVIWTKNNQRLHLRLDSFKARTVDGWLLAQVDAETDQTGRETLQFVFFLGRKDDGDGTSAATTINAATVQGAQIAELWGRDLQRVLWDAVLDTIDLSLARAASQAGNQPVTLAGFFVDATSITVNVIAGAK